MEAPFLSPEKAGAQRKEFFLHPNWESFLDLTGGDIQAVRVITMAPELPGAEEFIRKAAENGIHVSIGHTAATDEQVHQAADWGATRVTHTYNAQTPFTHRAPGVPGAALTDDRLFAEFIGDGVHLHDDAVKVLLRCKGVDKVVAITDSMEAAGLPDGEYALGGQAVTVRGHEARLHDGTLAGSVLLMRQAFQNLMARYGQTPENAARICTENPARSIGASGFGTICVGAGAPLTRWGKNFAWKGILG